MDGQATRALERWREQLDGWAIPEEILAAAPESPWGFPVGLFRSRARRAGSRPATPSNLEAARFLPAGGSVLDVGAGGGAASLPLAGSAGRLVAVDESPAMVASFLAAAEAAGVPAEGVEGRWPEVAGRVGPADVVVCHHVLYNVADLAPFAHALTGHARRRVVAELTERHPLVGLGPLWRRFHDLERPTGPGADDPARETWIRKTPGVSGGEACIRSTRITVWGLVAWRNLGLTDAEVRARVPDATPADLRAAWAGVRLNSREKFRKRSRASPCASTRITQTNDVLRKVCVLSPLPM